MAVHLSLATQAIKSSTSNQLNAKTSVLIHGTSNWHQQATHALHKHDSLQLVRSPGSVEVLAKEEWEMRAAFLAPRLLSLQALLVFLALNLSETKAWAIWTSGWSSIEIWESEPKSKSKEQTKVWNCWPESGNWEEEEGWGWIKDKARAEVMAGGDLRAWTRGQDGQEPRQDLEVRFGLS